MAGGRGGARAGARAAVAVEQVGAGGGQMQYLLLSGLERVHGRGIVGPGARTRRGEESWAQVKATAASPNFRSGAEVWGGCTYSWNLSGCPRLTPPVG